METASKYSKEQKHSMKRRSDAHDYYDRGIYMLTLETANRQPLFGRIEDAKMQLSELGAQIEQEAMHIPDYHPQLEILQVQLMPDHLHLLVFVHEKTTAHLSEIVRGFKIGCNRLYNATIQTSHTITKNGNTTERIPLFGRGYHDRILRNHNQLNVLRDYIKDNPRRLWIKRHHHDLFEHVTNLTYSTQTYAAIGNRFLLDRPDKIQVQCSRSITEEDLLAKQKKLIEAGQKGAILVSPCISPGEKQIARAALEAKVPLIVLLENGFPEYYKPPKTYFEACAAGHLLMLAPWPYHFEKRAITRVQCLALNTMAEDICNNKTAAI